MNMSKVGHKLPVIVTGKQKCSTSRRQVLPDIDLRQTGFTWTAPSRTFWIINSHVLTYVKIY